MWPEQAPVFLQPAFPHLYRGHLHFLKDGGGKGTFLEAKEGGQTLEACCLRLLSMNSLLSLAAV